MGAKTGGFVERVGVPVVIVIWYSCSVIGNNAGKVVLPLFPYPYSLSIIQFAIGSCSVPLVLLLRGKPVAPLLKVPLRSTDRGILLGVSGICSNLFQRVAIMFISVSFTHTVKASQPLFSGQTRAKLCLCGPDSILSRSLDAFFFSLCCTYLPQ